MAWAWGPLGPAESAAAFKIYFLPFVEPIDLDTAVGKEVLDYVGPAAPWVLLGIGLLIQTQVINPIRREQEGKVAGAVAGAAANAAGSAAKSVFQRLTEVRAEQWLKLLICLAIDAAGDSTYLLPGLGEAADVGYAPLEALALRSLFGGNLLAVLGFAEELLPGTDVFPTATIGWVLQTLTPESPLTSFLGIEPLAEPTPASRDTGPETKGKEAAATGAVPGPGGPARNGVPGPGAASAPPPSGTPAEARPEKRPNAS